MAAFDPVTAAFEIGGKLIDRLWPTPESKAAATLELAKLKQTGELAQMTDNTEQFKIAVADLNSARERESKIATSESAPYINKIVTPILALGIILGVFGGMLWLVRIVDGDINPAQKDVVIYILGALTAMGTQVISYYFGSSRGDAAKDQALRDIARAKD